MIWPHEGKSIPVGVQTDNQCCICCDQCWDNNCINMFELITEGRCCGHSNASDPSVPEGQAMHTGLCPSSCCACPPTGDLCMTLDTGGTCPTIDGMEITLTPSVGLGLCSGENPVDRDNEPCYLDLGIGTLQTGIQKQWNGYEKWGFSGIICNGLTVAGCSETTVGEKIKVSLCCCDICNQSISVTSANKSDCHSCSYRLTFEWERHIPNPASVLDDFCSCPEPDSYGDVDQMIPACDSVGPISCPQPWWDFEFAGGTCPTGNPSPGRPFLLSYELGAPRAAEGGWWNCDCCQNGYGAGDNDVEITVTIVDGTCS